MQKRDLLFALLALQYDFIKQDQLLGAFRSWLADKSKSLVSILVEKAAISGDDVTLFDRLVDKHLEKFAGDAAQSLANLSGIDSLGDQLQQLAEGDSDALRTVSYLHVNKSASFATVSMATQYDAVRRGAAIHVQAPTGENRFRIVKEHAKGGLGVVFVAEDQHLKREVALKQIRHDRADIDIYRQKFLQEAEVTGQLEHPGIVPVYALGTDDEGRPYYAMRFIKGEDLQSRIRKFHEDLKNGNCDFDGPELRSLLRRFIDVCNAVDYAHDRGVLHRDLKPGNIMLGKHGETLVVDWGLAKPLGLRPGKDPDGTSDMDSELPVPCSEDDISQTRFGTFLGTRAYAPPEQLLGQLDNLTPASDVYALGAILYELLTGQHPSVQNITSDTELAEAILNSKIARPRSKSTAIPKSLEAVCLKAISPRQSDRYSDANALRSDIEHWLDDAAVSAFAEPITSRIQRWSRKHRTIVRTLILATITIAVLQFWSNRKLAESNRNLLLADIVDKIPIQPSSSLERLEQLGPPRNYFERRIAHAARDAVLTYSDVPPANYVIGTLYSVDEKTLSFALVNGDYALSALYSRDSHLLETNLPLESEPDSSNRGTKAEIQLADGAVIRIDSILRVNDYKNNQKFDKVTLAKLKVDKGLEQFELIVAPMNDNDRDSIRLAATSDKYKVALLAANRVYTVDTQTGKGGEIVSTLSLCLTASLSPKGQYAAFIGLNRRGSDFSRIGIEVVDLSQGKLVFKGHYKSEFLLAQMKEQGISVGDTSQAFTYSITGLPNCVWSSNESLLAIHTEMDSTKLHVVDLKDQRLGRRWQAHDQPIREARQFPLSDYSLTTIDDSGLVRNWHDKVIRNEWRLPSYKKHSSILLRDRTLTVIEWQPAPVDSKTSNTLLESCLTSFKTKIFDRRTGMLIKELPQLEIRNLPENELYRCGNIPHEKLPLIPTASASGSVIAWVETDNDSSLLKIFQFSSPTKVESHPISEPIAMRFDKENDNKLHFIDAPLDPNLLNEWGDQPAVPLTLRTLNLDPALSETQTNLTLPAIARDRSHWVERAAQYWMQNGLIETEVIFNRTRGVSLGSLEFGKQVYRLTKKRYLFMGFRSRKVEVREILVGGFSRLIHTFHFEFPLNVLGFSFLENNNIMLVSAPDKTFTYYDLSTGKKLGTLPVPHDLRITGGSDYDPSQDILLWDDTGNIVQIPRM